MFQACTVENAVSSAQGTALRLDRIILNAEKAHTPSGRPPHADQILGKSSAWFAAHPRCAVGVGNPADPKRHRSRTRGLIPTAARPGVHEAVSSLL